MPYVKSVLREIAIQLTWSRFVSILAFLAMRDEIKDARDWPSIWRGIVVGVSVVCIANLALALPLAIRSLLKRLVDDRKAPESA